MMSDNPLLDIMEKMERAILLSRINEKGISEPTETSLDKEGVNE